MEVVAWKGLQMGHNAPIISHIFFADDCLLFLQSVDVFLDIFQKYELSSGQKINYQKSFVYFAKHIPVGRQDEII